MSMSFSTANQFFGPYKPRRLGNWQVPKWYPDTALPRTGKTVVVANDRGHLLPGIPRSKDNPWGNYIGTWNLPIKISRDLANKLSAPNKFQVNAYKRKLENFKKQQQLQKAKLVKIKIEEQKTCMCSGECSCRNRGESPKIEKISESGRDSGIGDEVKEDKVPYVPGDFCSENDKLESHLILNEQRNKSPEIKTSKNGFPLHKNVDIPDPPSPKNSISKSKSSSKSTVRSKLSDKSSIKSVSPPSTLSTENMSYCKEHDLPKRSSHEVKAYIDTVKNFQLARELHKVNLEHEPLPDTVPDLEFRKMQMREPDRPPGLAIKGKNFATAIGWKGYSGYGANRCTKLKVFRPTTTNGRPNFEGSGRPSSVNSFDKKWRFIRQNKVTPMDLAICWDLTPNNPQDEPKRTKHIDGSNGSQAPGIFQMVQTPKGEEDDEKRGNTPAIFSKVEDSEMVKKIGDLPIPHDECYMRPKTTNYQQEKKISTAEIHRAKSAIDLNAQKASASKKQKSFYQSTPDVSINSKCGKDCCQKIFNTRLCVACELKQLPTKPETKEEYKMAFKAGVPNNTRSPSSSSSGSVKVPKQKDPYSKKNYTINSLSPPFCLPKAKREDYPEHWRLASVYQHSYKPIHLRKKPLLQSVFQ